MPKKRKSGGRSKGRSAGRSPYLICDFCGKRVPSDKMKKITRWYSPVDPQTKKELKKKGARVPRYRVTKYICIPCAIHRGIIKIRSEEERKEVQPL